MDNKKFFIFMIMGIFLLSSVSAFQLCEWIPFWSCEGHDGKTLISTDKWMVSPVNKFQKEKENFNTTIKNLGEGKAEICFIPKEKIKTNNNIIAEQKITLKQKNTFSKKKKPLNIEMEKDGIHVKQMCINVDKLTEDYIEFEDAIEYQPEVLEVKDDEGINLQDITLIKNTDQCLVNCYARGHTVIYKDSALFEGFDFVDINGDIIDVSNSKISLLVNDEKIITTPVYSKNCINKTNLNGTICEYIIEGYENHTEITSYYKKYNMETLPVGAYDWQISATKNSKTPIDWAVSFQGFSTDTIREYWAWWSTDWSHFKEYNNLSGNISYMKINKTNDDDSDFADTRFISCYNDSMEFNYTLESKVGTYGIFRVNTLGENCTLRYYGNSEATSTSSASDVYFEPISMYYFDDNANDFVGGNNGTVNGASLAAGYINNSYDFERSESDYISLPSSATPNSGEFTINAWIKPESTGTGTIWRAGVTSGVPFNIFEVNNDGAFRLRAFDVGGGSSDIYSTTTLIPGSWYMATLVIDSSDNMLLYLNGTNEVNGTSWTMRTGSENIGAGYNSGTLTQFFDGVIDEVTTWDKALTSEQILALYSQTEPIFIEGQEENRSNIQILYPLNTTYSDFVTSLNYKTFSNNITSCWYSLDGGLNTSTPGSCNNFTGLISNVGINTWIVYGNNTETGVVSSDNVTFFVNKSIKTELLTPVNNGTSSEIKTNFTFNSIPINDNLTNATLYVWNNSGLNLIDTNFTTLSGSSSIESSLTIELLDGNYTWNVESCVAYGGCNFAPTNFSFELHSVAPTVNIIFPSGNISFFLMGENETLNYNISESGQNLTEHLDECWFYYNGSNETLDCFSNESSFSYVLGNNNITVYAKDIFGNIGSSFSHWEYKIIEIEQSFNPTAIETTAENFKINISYSSSDWISAVAYLNYDGEKHIASGTGSGDIIEFNTDIYIPEVSAQTNKTFNWTISLTNSTGTYNFTSSDKIQTVSRVDFYLCDYSDNPQLFFQTRSTTNPTQRVNATFASAWTLRNAAGGDVVLNRAYEDITETNSTWGFCIRPNTTVYTVSVDVTVDATDYTPSSHYIVDTDYSGPSENITLYLLSDNESTLTELKVTDLNYDAIEGAYIIIQRYDMGTNTYYNVAMARTNSMGSDLAYLKWYDDWYKFIIVIDGEVMLTDGPRKISSSPLSFRVGEDYVSDYTKFRDIDYSLIFNDATDNFVLTFVSPSGEVSSSCLRVMKRNITADYLICDVCESSSSATLYCNIGGYGNGTFIANFYATGSPPYWIEQLYEYRNVQNKFYDMIGNDNGTGFAILIAGIILSFFLFSPAMGVLGTIIGVVGAIALGFQPFEYLSLVGLVVIGLSIMWVVKK